MSLLIRAFFLNLILAFTMMEGYMDKFSNVVIDRLDPRPIYIQIAQGIEFLIKNDQLSSDEKLPAIRKMSTYFHVNNETVVKAYGVLEQKSLAYKVKGSGTYVTPQTKALIAKISEFENMDHLSFGLNLPSECPSQKINFASATPKAALFPVSDFKEAINEVLDRELGEAFSYQEAKGYFPLRESICSYLNDFNISANPKDVQIISGAQQGLDIISKSLLDHNDTVVIEAPTYTGAIATFRSRGVKVIEVPMLMDGVSIEKLESLIRRHRPKLMFTMAHCHNPTGYSYSMKKKRALLELAEKYNFFVLEDDYVGELMYTNQEVFPIKALDHNQRVIYLKSFSKILMPGLRLGFMIVPEFLSAKVQKTKEATDISTSGLIQKAFDLYLRKGYWSKQLEAMKMIYKNRYETMIEALNTWLPRSINYYVPKGGIMFWIELPKGYDSRAFYNFMDKQKIDFVPGDMFYYSHKTSRAIRLCIAAVTKEDIEEGIPLLCALIRDYVGMSKKRIKK